MDGADEVHRAELCEPHPLARPPLSPTVAGQPHPGSEEGPPGEPRAIDSQAARTAEYIRTANQVEGGLPNDLRVPAVPGYDRRTGAVQGLCRSEAEPRSMGHPPDRLAGGLDQIVPASDGQQLGGWIPRQQLGGQLPLRAALIWPSAPDLHRLRERVESRPGVAGGRWATDPRPAGAAPRPARAEPPLPEARPGLG